MYTVWFINKFHDNNSITFIKINHILGHTMSFTPWKDIWKYTIISFLYYIWIDISLFELDCHKMYTLNPKANTKITKEL